MAEEVGLMEFVTGGQDDGRQEEVEEDLVVETDEVLEGFTTSDSKGQTDDHACRRVSSLSYIRSDSHEHFVPAKMDATVS